MIGNIDHLRANLSAMDMLVHVRNRMNQKSKRFRKYMH